MVENLSKYERLALQHAETYGILEYRVRGNKMIYNQNYKNAQFINGKWRENPITYQRIVNLDTNTTESKQLKHVMSDGWHNV